MKLPSTCRFLFLLLTTFAALSLSGYAETHCPGNVTGFKPRIVAGALLVIPVRVNQSGPFDFMVDTGSQLNVIDPALAAQLDLKLQDTVGVIATAAYSHASAGVLDSLQAGSQTVSKPLVVVQDLGAIQAADPRIRGVLGENFLAHFNMLVDYSRPLLCLDDAGLMENSLRGERIPLVTPGQSDTEVPFSGRLVISVNLSGMGAQPILLQLDSGSDGPILFGGSRQLVQPLLKRAKLQGPEVSEARRAFAVLPVQEMRVGSRIVRSVPFVTPVGGSQNIPDRVEDGILATVLFHRVYVSHSGRFVVFDPK